NGDDLPVMRVTRPEAEAAARWLGGRLPTAEELDMAAGFWRQEGRPGPAKGPNVAVNLAALGPWPVDFPQSDDVSPLGIRDLAGNGEEWTSTSVVVGGVPEETFAVLRGKSYLSREPLLFSDMVNRQKTPLRQLPDTARPWTGFRVAVGLPPR